MCGAGGGLREEWGLCGGFLPGGNSCFRAECFSRALLPTGPWPGSVPAGPARLCRVLHTSRTGSPPIPLDIPSAFPKDRLPLCNLPSDLKDRISFIAPMIASL